MLKKSSKNTFKPPVFNNPVKQQCQTLDDTTEDIFELSQKSHSSQKQQSQKSQSHSIQKENCSQIHNSQKHNSSQNQPAQCLSSQKDLSGTKSSQHSLKQCPKRLSQRSEILGSQNAFSQPDAHLSLKERLLWLRERRDVGIWVQCSSPTCNKWRFLHNTRDPVDVPEEWFCYMNPDKNYNYCNATEKPPTVIEENDLIHNIYNAGSIVWGRVAGFPWWPAIVDDDPDVEQYYWLNDFSDIPTHYNVVFFDEEEVTRAWLTPGLMRPFTGRENTREFRKTTARGINFAKRLQAARIQAQKALPMSVRERLETYGFLARYKGNIGKQRCRKEQVNKRKPDDDEFDELFPPSESDNEKSSDAENKICKEKNKKKKPKLDNNTDSSMKTVKKKNTEKKEKKTMEMNNDSKLKSNVLKEKNDGTIVKKKVAKKLVMNVDQCNRKQIDKKPKKSKSQNETSTLSTSEENTDISTKAVVGGNKSMRKQIRDIFKVKKNNKNEAKSTKDVSNNKKDSQITIMEGEEDSSKISNEVIVESPRQREADSSTQADSSQRVPNNSQLSHTNNDNSDAVVPQLNNEDSSHSSCSFDFDPEE